MRLSPWHFAFSVTVLVVVALSGILWFARHDLLEVEPDDVQRLTLAVHGISAYGALLIFGSVMPRHIRLGWRNRHNLTTGLVFTTAMILLTVTGLGLYYASEELRDWSRLVHIAVGFAAVALFPLHVVIGRRLRRGAAAEPAQAMRLLAEPPA